MLGTHLTIQVFQPVYLFRGGCPIQENLFVINNSDIKATFIERLTCFGDILNKNNLVRMQKMAEWDTMELTGQPCIKDTCVVDNVKLFKILDHYLRQYALAYKPPVPRVLESMDTITEIINKEYGNIEMTVRDQASMNKLHTLLLEHKGNTRFNYGRFLVWHNSDQI